LISKTAEYALSALVCLTHEGRGLTAKEIAQATGMPEGYLAKVLRTMARLGLVRSRRGPTGGFTLGRPPDRMTLGEVIDAIEPQRNQPLADGAMLAGLCERIRSARDAERSVFRGVTLADVVAEDPDGELHG
jgi:Rrf2 family protein